MAKPPAFQFYAQDFMIGTLNMTLAERGAYITLLSYMWGSGPLRVHDRDLYRVLGCTPREARRVWPAVAAKLKRTRRGYISERLEAERDKQDAYRQKQSAKGSASAQARFNRGSTAASSRLQPDGNSSSSSSEYVPPKPPSSEGGSSKPITRQERKRAEHKREMARGCPHEPMCHDYERCIARFVRAMRDEHAAGLCEVTP